jgi:hypothetical protein
MPKKRRFILEPIRVYYVYDKLLKSYITDELGELVNFSDREFAQQLTEQLTKWDLPEFRINHPKYGKCLFDIEMGLVGTKGYFYSSKEETHKVIDLVGTTMESLIPLLQFKTRSHWNMDPPEL